MENLARLKQNVFGKVISLFKVFLCCFYVLINMTMLYNRIYDMKFIMELKARVGFVLGTRMCGVCAGVRELDVGIYER